MSRSRLNPWPSLADLFSALMVGSIAALVMTALSLETTARQLRDAETRVDELKSQLLACQKKSSPEECKSVQTPMCNEKQLKKQFNAVLFHAIVLGPNLFRVGDSEYSMSDLNSAYATQQRQAVDNGCIFR